MRKGDLSCFFYSIRNICLMFILGLVWDFAKENVYKWILIEFFNLWKFLLYLRSYWHAICVLSNYFFFSCFEIWIEQKFSGKLVNCWTFHLCEEYYTFYCTKFYFFICPQNNDNICHYRFYNWGRIFLTQN